MMPAMPMQMNAPMGMMPGMSMGMMPMAMMPGMPMGMMPMGMMPVMPLPCRMAVEMGKDGIVCRLMPAEGVPPEALHERFDAMMKLMAMGMPMMMACGNLPLLCLPVTR